MEKCSPKSRLTAMSAVLILGLLGSGSYAQYSNNYQTNTISGVVSNWAGNYIVGSNTLAAVLQILSGGILTNSHGYIGYESASINNGVLVEGSNSLWANTRNLFVGYAGASNRLYLSTGARVYDATG